ncbi:MAG TPA: DUF2207 domain-containing protein [Limnochordia bacterium]|nr:DUF2207 domain-containing protein [Limnochordia bacterium]
MRNWLCWLVVFCLLLMPTAALARSYELLELNIEAQVGADAVVRITETHTVRFNGTYSGMYQTFDTSQGIAIKDVLVSEGGQAYRQIPGETPGEPGTFFVKEGGDEVLVDWSFSATDEVREFQVSYTLHNAILKHNDVAEFYYQFVGTGWDLPREHVRIALTLPHGAEPDQIAAWGYGPRHGTVTIESPTRIVWEVAQLPANTFVEGRVVFPNALVPLGTRYTNQNGLERILKEEQVREEQRQRAAQRRALDPFVAVGVFLLALLVALHLWRKFIQASPLGFNDRYYKNLPGDYPPAELAILLNRTVQGRDFAATLLDLARRGYLSIEELTGPQSRTGKGQADYRFKKGEVSAEKLEELRPYEGQILELLFEDLKSEEVTLEEFQKYAQKNPRKFSVFWKKWGEAVQDAAKGHGFFAEEQNKKALVYLLPAVGLLILAVPAGLLSMFVTLGVCVVMGLVTVILVAVAGSQRSQYGREQYAKWVAFRRYLQEFSRVDQLRLGQLGIWEQFLPYAVTLGVADLVLKQLEMHISTSQEGYRFGSGWFIYYHPAGFHSLHRMTRSVEKSITSVTLPQGTGGSGGFSGGGGGGFGGGGGGAR